ncbi:uncharacterized protein LOC125556698 [Nematostella vectensis]|uniref:uncharacterized protein LOC125556698 n=1 Tax=Nematostella vectensis TaxID=45351 RepID=UPI002076F026|nr:uncharacterized protein LOC125556698 [Nematostella vectensis]
MDMQYVLDPYACATYILSYITKGQRGMSKLLEKATEEVKSGNRDIANKVRHIGNRFLNAVEISAQEAAYLVLQMPMRRSTREFQFINTSHPDERTFFLKKFDKLKELPDNSPDIESDNLIKRYQRRLKKLEKLCLAEFAAWFNCVSDKHADSASDKAFATGPDDFMPETNLEDNTDDDVPITEDVNEQESDTNQYHMRGGINLIKRKRPKIIRSVIIIILVTMLLQIQNINEQDRAIKEKPSELFGCFDPGKNKQHNQYDLLDDIGIFPRYNDQEELVVKRVSDFEYCALVRSLNEKQRQFFYHVLHTIKTSDEPLRLFLSGGAGVGKSSVTNVLYKALIRYLNSIVGENPDEIKVLKTAPTGKAAFNIKGYTLHAAFKIPANKGFEYCAFDNDRLNTIKAKLRKLHVLFIDEMSMVASGMFNFLNLRLQQIMGSKVPFGGISLIAIGDLFN